MRKTRKALVDLMKREAEWHLSKLQIENSREAQIYLGAQYITTISILRAADEITNEQYQEYLKRYTK